MEKYEKNLGNLTENQLDFLEYSLYNYEQLLDKKISDIAKEYGIGVSFVYNFFNKLGVSNLKEYIFFLGYTLARRKMIPQSYKHENDFYVEDIKELMKLSNEFNFQIIEKQKSKIESLIFDIHEYQEIFYLGLGYSKLAVLDYQGFYTYLDKEIFTLDDNDPDFNSKINNESLLVIYSLRAMNKKINLWTKKIRKKFPKVKIYLITSNVKTTVKEYCDEVIEIDNLLKRVDGLRVGIMLSPLSPFISLNNIIKTMYFYKYQKELFESKKFKQEIESWRDDKLAKYEE